MYLWLLLALLVLIALYLYIQNNVFSKSTYKIHMPKLHANVKDKKIVFLSDTHFRKNLSHSFIDRLLIQIEKINPDLIFFGGDIIHKETSDMVIEHVKDFFSQLGNIAPTYTILGNHDLSNTRIKEIEGVLNRAGVQLLKNEATWISFDQPGAGFWLTGLNDYDSSIGIKNDVLKPIKMPKDSKNEPKILLTHYPHYFEKYLTNDDKRPDLILAGHAHGGQVILPIIGGLYAPGQGYNPTYDFGVFTSEKHPNSRLILTRGLGNSSCPLRINNRPEIVIIEFE